MVTIDAAYTLGVDDHIGSIETGKFADFVVLDEDPHDVDPMKIKDIGVVATILAGDVTLTSDDAQRRTGNSRSADNRPRPAGPGRRRPRPPPKSETFACPGFASPVSARA